MRQPNQQRPGYVIIAVLMVIVVLSLVGYRFADAMSAQDQVSYRVNEAADAKSFAISGVHYTMGLLADPNSMTSILGDNPYDNYNALTDVVVTNEGPRGGGRFAIMSIAENDMAGAERYGLRYGVTDEAGKINLNTMMRIDSSGEALRAMLILLPNMTDEVADSIADWLDADDDQRASGAEAAAYVNYRPRNGPINTLDELLLVRGVTIANLYGNDLNRNGLLEPNEEDGNELNRGWSDYLTVYGHELNVDSTGQPRFYVNDADLAAVNQGVAAILGQPMADYITAYRIYSTSSATNAPSGNTKLGTADDLRQAVQSSLGSSPRARRQVRNSVLSLVNTRVTLPKAPGAPNNAPTLVIDCPLNDPAILKSVMSTIMDKVTAKKSYELNPRINVNTCPPTLLSVLPGVTPEDAAAALSVRASLDPLSSEYRTGAWLHTQAGMRIEIFKNIETYITGQTQTYRIQSIGYFANGGPVARVEAVIDTNGGHPRIVYFRDLTELGGGFTPPRD